MNPLPPWLHEDDEEEREREVVVKDESLHAKVLEARAVIISEPITSRLARNVTPSSSFSTPQTPRRRSRCLSIRRAARRLGLAIFDMIPVLSGRR